MIPGDFFVQVEDDYGERLAIFNHDLLERLKKGEVRGYSDLDAAHALARLMKSELTIFATDGDQRLDNEQSSIALRVLKAVLHRLGVVFKPPFDDFEGWHGYWSAQGMTHGGSWAIRRGYINDLFAPVLARLDELEFGKSDTGGFRGVDGEMKNLIFASTSYKPDIVLRDAISNTIEVVENAESCLIYNRPLASTGLSWGELVAWWQHEQQADLLTEQQAGHQLYWRLSSSLGSPPERILFRTYCERYGDEGGRDIPALLPQVYLHYDPLTRKQRKTLNMADRLNRERMDFLLMLPGGVRIVLEVDGSQHYSVDGEASPRLYGEMMAEDRALRLQGYEVFRFGGGELMSDGAADLLRNFFDLLETRFGSEI
jgi:very-short-patch-repair endonuclease